VTPACRVASDRSANHPQDLLGAVDEVLQAELAGAVRALANSAAHHLFLDLHLRGAWRPQLADCHLAAISNALTAETTTSCSSVITSRVFLPSRVAGDHNLATGLHLRQQFG
jgi:hypothetical protein